MATSSTLKKNYKCVPSLQQFYTGGPFAVSSDATFIACACEDKIKIINSSNSSIKSTIDGDSEKITALTLSPDDRFLFSSSQSRQIIVWDLQTLKCLRSWKGHEGPVKAMACDASGGVLATAGADGKVRVWDVDGGFCTHYFKGHKAVVTSIMFHPDPHQLLLFSGSDDATVRVWDLVSKNCLAVLEKHFSTVTSLAVSENGWTLLSAGRDKVVNLWDLRNYEFKLTIPTYEVIESICAVPSGSRLASCLRINEKQSGKGKKIGSPPIYFLTAGERGIVRIWNSEGAVCLFEQHSSDSTVTSDEDNERRGFTSAVMLPLDQGLLCVTADQQFLFYDPDQSEEMFKLKLSKRLVGNNEEIVDMKFLGEEEQHLAVATNLEQVRVYDLASMSCSYVFTGHTDTVLSMDTCTSSAGKTLLVTGSKDNSVRLWEQEGRCCIGVGTGHLGAIGAVAFSKKRKNFFVSGSSDRTLKIWSLDGLPEDGSNQVINLKTKAVVAAHDKDINTVAVAPNDAYVCSGSQDRTACIWKLPDLVSVVVLKGHKRGIWSVEFSPVDLCVLTASGDKTIKMWSIPDGSCLRTFEGHTASVLRASFITRGAQIVSSGADGLIKLWTIKTSECIATYDHHEEKVWALTVGKKTEMLATGGGDAVVNIWYDSTVADKEEAFRKEEEGVLKGQELENAVSDADYARAIRVAFELKRPHKLFDIFSDLCKKKHAGEEVDKAIRTLEKEQVHLLFEYAREWNTKPKLCHIAQFLLFRVFNILSPKDILEIKGISEVLEGLIPYSQRHFTRIDRLIRSSLLLDYTLSAMSVIEPPKEEVKIVEDVREEERMESPVAEVKSSKKRKSGKSRTGKEKKAKEVAYIDVSAAPISLKA